MYYLLLCKQKDHAVRNEDFEHAKKLKLHIEEIKLMGMQIKELDDRKRFAIQNEDYDTAQQLKR
jgi:centrosomal protein CEP104